MAEQRKYDQAIIDLVEMSKMLRDDLKMLRDEMKEQRRLDNELIGVLGDLRSELEHLRTERFRDDRWRKLAENVRPKPAKKKTLAKRIK